MNRNAFLAGEWTRVHDEIAMLKEAARGAVLKVILETGELETYDNVRRASAVAMAAGADFVKTSTGFAKGGATVADVALMRRVVGESMGVKAAGGVKDYEALKAMVAAGASRVGASAGIRIVREAAGQGTPSGAPPSY